MGKSADYTISYLDNDNDPIAIEDDDDLSVCVLEFSEMSKIDDFIRLLVLAKDPSIPRRRDTPKGSRDNSKNKEVPKKDVVDVVEVVEEKVEKIEKAESFKVLSESEDAKSLAQSQISVEEVSEKVMSMMESKMSEELDKKMEALLEKKVAEKMM